jgi:hypothetical protein
VCGEFKTDGVVLMFTVVTRRHGGARVGRRERPLGPSRSEHHQRRWSCHCCASPTA